MSLLEVHDVDKTFLSGGEAVPVLRGGLSAGSGR